MSVEQALPDIQDSTTAFAHIPDHGLSLFLAKRCKTIHFIRHAEGTHNEVNKAAGNDWPVTYSDEKNETELKEAWKHIDAKLTDNGIQQCLEVRKVALSEAKPEIIVVSPFTRTLQTAHVLFGGHNIPFVVQDLARERSGKYTCDKRRPRNEIVNEMKPLYDSTNDYVDWDSYGYPTSDDTNWTPEREDSEKVTKRGIALLEWLAKRPEQEMAVVSHSSFLKHLFRAFGEQIHPKDQKDLHRLAGNAEVRSVCLALHKGFYPEGTWEGPGSNEGGGEFVPTDPGFRRGKWGPSRQRIADLHKALRSDD